jgi:hypothetical protein
VLKDVLLALNEADAAVDVARSSVEVDRAAQPPDEEWTATALTRLAGTLNDLHRYAAAEPVFRELVALRAKIFPEGHRLHALQFVAMSQLGGVLIELGADETRPVEDRRARLEEAETLLLQAREQLQHEGDTAGVPSVADRLEETTLGLVKLYEARDRLEPGAGFDVQAQTWRARRTP